MLHPIIFAVVVAVEVATMSEVLVDSRAATIILQDHLDQAVQIPPEDIP